MNEKHTSEAQLQSSCVIWFNNNLNNYRGCLVEINNNTNKGAYRKSLGQVKYASDLVLYDNYAGRVLFIEMKLNGSTHKVAHLKGQLDWLNKMDLGFFSMFCFSKGMFEDAITMFINMDDFELFQICQKTRNFVDSKIIEAEFRGVKSVKLDYYG